MALSDEAFPTITNPETGEEEPHPATIDEWEDPQTGKRIRREGVTVAAIGQLSGVLAEEDGYPDNHGFTRPKGPERQRDIGPDHQ